MAYRWFGVRDLSRINGWERRELKREDESTEYGEVWQCEDDSTEEVIVDRSGPQEPRNWSVILPDGQQRFTQYREIATGIAELYMKTGSL